MPTPDPAFIQHNLHTLMAIGGVYDFLAFAVERDHAELLRQHRLDTGAKSVMELLQERADRHYIELELETRNAKDDPGTA